MILRGIVMGFFFPILPLFFLRDAKPAAFWDDGSEVQPTENVIFPYVATLAVLVDPNRVLDARRSWAL